MRTRSWVALALVSMAGLLLAGRSATSLIVDRTWYAAFNADAVFWEQVTDSVLLRGGLWLLGTLFAFANLAAVRRTILAVAVPARVGNIDISEMISAQRLLAFTVGVAALVGLVLVLPFDDWTAVALVRHGVPFIEIDGIFSRDLGFYVYWLPFEETLYIWALLGIVIVTAMVIVLYAMTRSLRLEGRRIIASTHVRRHLTVLSVLVMLLLAWSYRLDAFDLLRYGSGDDGVFVRVDHVVTIVIDRVLAISMACATLVLLRAGWLGHVRTALVTLSLVLVGALGLRHAVPPIVARTRLVGDPGKRDQDYVATRTLVTRRAYDVDGIVVTRADSLEDRASALRFEELPGTLSVWDAGLLVRALRSQTSALVLVEPVAWTRSGESLQALLLERPAAMGGAWSLLRIEGSVADPRGAPITNGAEQAAQVDSTSFATNDDESGSFAEPLITPAATGHRLVVDSTTRIVGARLDSWSARVAHAWAARDPRLLAEDPNGVIPTLVQWRDVRARVRRLAPIFAQGNDVLPLVYEGTLYWSVELYSASDSYPLSQQWSFAGDVRSYFKHAATALVNSRTGRVQLVRVARPDPLARTWMNLAPSLFVPVSGLAPGLAQLLPAPTDGAMAQLRAFARYGSRLDGPAERHWPDSLSGGDELPARTVGGRSPGVGWSVPFLDGPEQIAGTAIAFGGAQRGTRWVAASAPFSRWSVLAARLRNALDSARSSLGESGHREPHVSFGRVRCVLVSGAAVLVQPMFMDRLNGAPALVRVGVVTNGATVVGTSLADAVRRLPGMAELSPSSVAGGRVVRARGSRDVEVARLYDSMRSALKRGDFVRFGAAFDSLGVLLGRPPQ